MAKRFLASTGVGYLYARIQNELQMVARVNTLTESTLSITSTQEEVRAGQGAKLYGRFNHDAGLTVTLTDAMFDLNYIRWQVGGTIMHNPSVIYYDQGASYDAGTITLTGKPAAMGESCGFDNIIVWYRAAGCDADDQYYSTVLTSTQASAATVSFQADEQFVASNPEGVCVYYFTANQAATGVLVNANFVPAELVLVLTTKLFAGDSKNPETGKPVGEITIKIPRFSLDGAFDLSMAMSSAATMSLNGTALATESSECDGDGIYAEIVQVIEGAVWTDGLIGIVVDDDTMANTDFGTNYQITTYAVYRDGMPAIVDPTLLSYNAGTTGATISEAGVVTVAPTTAGEIAVSIKDATGKLAEEKAIITVTVE